MKFDAARQSAPTIGITYDTRNDLKFASDDPWEWDAEFEASMSIDDITSAIEDAGFPTIVIGNPARLADGLAAYRKSTQMIFHVPGDRTGGSGGMAVSGMLESCGMEHVGPDTETLAISSNRALARHIMSANNIRMPESAVLSDAEEIRRDLVPEYPVILKLSHGRRRTSVHERTKIHDFEQLKRHARYMLRTYGQDVLIERFIEGREFEVPILGTNPGDVFGIVEVTLNGRQMGSNHIAPMFMYSDDYGFGMADVQDGLPDVEAMALTAYMSLHCRDFGSADIRVEESTGRPYLMEINPCPYLGTHGSFGHAAKSRGMEHGEIIGTILDGALKRRGH